MKRRLVTRALAGLLPLVHAIAGPAEAQQADPKVVAAQTLFDEARGLMKESRFAEACKKFAASQKLDPGAGTLLNLAACYEKTGQTASAWITFKDAAVAASGRHPDWVAEANEQAAALEPRLSHLTIRAATTPGLVVKRDGTTVEPSTFGVALPVDPGQHTIEATATGHTSFRATVDVGTQKDDKEVSVPALTEVATKTSSRVVVGGAIAGVGAVGLVVGSVLGVIALGKKSDAGQPGTCNTDLTVCSPEGKELVDSAKSTGLASTVFFIAGGAFLVGGLTLVLTAPSHQEDKESPSLRASIGPRGLVLGGSF